MSLLILFYPFILLLNSWTADFIHQYKWYVCSSTLDVWAGKERKQATVSVLSLGCFSRCFYGCFSTYLCKLTVDIKRHSGFPNNHSNSRLLIATGVSKTWEADCVSQKQQQHLRFSLTLLSHLVRARQHAGYPLELRHPRDVPAMSGYQVPNGEVHNLGGKGDTSLFFMWAWTSAS